jgi:hypothetical protein
MRMVPSAPHEANTLRCTAEKATLIQRGEPGRERGGGGEREEAGRDRGREGGREGGIQREGGRER